MLSPLSLELYAQDVRRDYANQAAHAALVAQLPRTPFVRPDLAARLRIAHGLRAVAARLDSRTASQLVMSPR